jgi:putative phosphoesterase
MKIGILSDTHGNLSTTRSAARQMAAAGVGAVFHCGDIGDVEVLAELAMVFQPLEVPVYVVFGNVDLFSEDWKFFPSNFGVELLGRFGEVELDGMKVAILHSDDRRRFRKTIERGGYDLVLSGHSHEIHDYQVGATRCVNPGSAGRGSPDCFAILDLSSGMLDWFNA